MSRLNNNKGFMLYVVVAVLLALAILAFALNSFKSGAITQLARNVDQNRLSLLAQSANAEVIAIIRSNANYQLDSDIFKKLRSVFPDKSGNAPPLKTKIVLIPSYVPENTMEIANSAGYKLVIKSRATLTAYREAPANSILAYNAYLDVISQAYRQGNEENMIEVRERRDVRLVDLRHRFDRYALFVKNYGPSYNHPHRRLLIEGVPPDGHAISHVYIGNKVYPDCADSKKYLWFDILFSESSKMPGFAKAVGHKGLTKFTGATMPDCLFDKQTQTFADLKGITPAQFYQVKAVYDLYEKFVNQAADGCLGNAEPSAETRDKLADLCRDAMAASNSNAASYVLCKDFADNFKMVGNRPDYSKCKGFQQILNTCIVKWNYIYGFTDANSIWRIDTMTPPNLPVPREWSTALAFGGLATTTAQYREKGPYFSEYLDEKDGKAYNPERIRVGYMPMLYGPSMNRKVFVEGPVFMRFFKVGFLDTFKQSMELLSKTVTIEPEPVPLNFYRYDKSPTFLNTQLADPVSTSGVHSERYLMSRAIDSIPINALLGDSVNIYDGDGKKITYNPVTVGVPNFVEPMQPAASSLKATTFGRLIDYKNVSWNYPNTASFVQHRIAPFDGEDTLFLDGLMYIEEGDLDLSKVNQFYGKGMIYIGRGNCILGDMRRLTGRDYDSLRIYLRAGKYLLKPGQDNFEIQASLAALYYPFGSSDPANMGGLILNGQQEVVIIGNLIVDYLYTHDKSNSGLADGGRLVIKHDPIIFNPAGKYDGEEQDPYHVSIGPVKTLFSINAGGKTF